MNTKNLLYFLKTFRNSQNYELNCFLVFKNFKMYCNYVLLDSKWTQWIASQELFDRRREGRLWWWGCHVCMQGAHQDWLWLQNAHFTILVPIWLQGMALTAVPAVNGENVTDDWWETSCEWLPSAWTWWHGPWHPGGQPHDGAILTLMMQQLRMTRHVTRSSRDTSQRYRGTDPDTIEGPG